ncbi:hypothetical protein [Streptomyces sp. NPDC002580]|uniref:hypothetical protein n=1 Tax=Streptomyces sp. NPDC002580 TaxID=3364653 RepID=UPI003676498D
MAGPVCAFCDIVAGRAPAERVVERDHWPDAVALVHDIPSESLAGVAGVAGPLRDMTAAAGSGRTRLASGWAGSRQAPSGGVRGLSRAQPFGLAASDRSAQTRAASASASCWGIPAFTRMIPRLPSGNFTLRASVPNRPGVASFGMFHLHSGSPR